MMNNSYGIENTEPQNELYDELAKFNWGAFFLNIFWAIPNGAIKDALPTLVIMFIVLLLSQIPLLGLIFVIINICLSVYLGKKGNEWAWYGKKWKSVDEFVATQKTWGGLSPFGFIALCVIIPSILSIAALLYARPYAKKVVARESSVIQTAVSRVVLAPDYKTFQSGKDVTNYLVDNNIYKRYFNPEDLNSVLAEKVGPYTLILSFEKNGICSLDKKNCYVRFYLKSGTSTPVLESKTYFDDDGLTEVVEVSGRKNRR